MIGFYTDVYVHTRFSLAGNVVRCLKQSIEVCERENITQVYDCVG